MKLFSTVLLGVLAFSSTALSLPEPQPVDKAGELLDKRTPYGHCVYKDTKKQYPEGMCLPVSECNKDKDAWTLSGFCPYDGNGIKCCVKVPCHPSKPYSACMFDSQCKSNGGKIIKKKCPGPSNLVCCYDY